MSWVQTWSYPPVSSWDACYLHSHQIRPGTVGMNLESGVHVLSWLSLETCSSQWTEKCSPRSIRPQIQGVLVYPSQKGRRVCSHLTLYPDYLEKNLNTFHCSVFTTFYHLISVCSTEATAERARRLPRVVCVALSGAPWKLLSKFSADFTTESSALSSTMLEKRKKENTRGGDECHLLSLLHSHDFISYHETVCGLEVLATAFYISWKKLYFGLASSTLILQSNEAVKATSLIYVGIKPDIKTGIPDIHV